MERITVVFVEPIPLECHFLGDLPVVDQQFLVMLQPRVKVENLFNCAVVYLSLNPTIITPASVPKFDLYLLTI